MNATEASAVAWAGLSPGAQAIHAHLRRLLPAIVQPLRPHLPFNASGDSMDFVELLCVIDAEYGVRLSSDDVAALVTVGDLLAFVDRHATRRPALSP